MTVNTTQGRVVYQGDGVTLDFPVTFIFFGAEELEVFRLAPTVPNVVRQNLNTQYTVSGGNGATGSIRVNIPVPATDRLAIRRRTKLTQEIDYTAFDKFPAETHERGLDRASARDQEQVEWLGRTMYVDAAEAPIGPLPLVKDRAGGYLAFGDEGELVITKDLPGGVVDPALIGRIQAATAAGQSAAANSQQALAAAQQERQLAQAARDQAVEAASSIDLDAINGRLDASDAAISSIDVRLDALELVGLDLDKVYLTEADMQTDLPNRAEGDHVIALDTGTEWYKQGGIWRPYPGDRYTRLEARVSALESATLVPNLADPNDALVTRCKINAAVEPSLLPRVSTSFTGSTLVVKRLAGANSSYNLHQGVLLKKVRTLKSRSVTLVGTFVEEYDANPGGTGFSIGFSPTLDPILGAAAYPAAGSVLFVTWRSNGVVQLHDGFDGPTGGNVYAGIGGTGFRYFQGETVRMVARFNETATSVLVYCIVNEVVRGTFRVNNLPVDWYFGPFVRTSFSTAAEGTEHRVSMFQLDTRPASTRTWYLDPAAAPGGDGSRARRFNKISDCALRMLQTGERHKVVMAPGQYRSGSFDFAASDMHELEFVAENSRGVTIMGSTYLPAAPGNWFKPDPVNLPNVWARPFRFAGQVPTSEAGAIIELGVPSYRRGVPVLPYRHPRRYTQFGAGSEAAALLLVNGYPSSQYISVATGLFYLHATDSADPNTRDYELCDQLSGIAVRGDSTDPVAPFDCEVRVTGVEVRYSYGSCFDLTRVRGTLTNCRGMGSGALNGFALNDFTGLAIRCVAEGNTNDGYNHSSLYGPAVPVATPGETVFFSCRGNYNGWAELAPWTDGRQYGDGNSNHTRANFTDYFGVYMDNGKCGVVPSMGNYIGYGVTCVGNLTSNFQLGGSEPNIQETMYLHQPVSTDSPIAFELYCSAGATNSTVQMFLYEPIIRNVPLGFLAVCTEAAPAVGQINVRNPRGRDIATMTQIIGTGVVQFEPVDLPLVAA